MKTAVITGASQGIGAAIAKRLNELGYNLVLNYKSNDEAMDDLIENFVCKNTDNIKVKCDISKYDEAKTLMDTAIEKFDNIDVLINNAGVTKDNLLMLMSEEDFDMVVDTNLKGTFNCCRHISKKMMKQKYGRIVNISSVVGIIGNGGQANYCAAKAGIIGMTKSMAKELAKKNISVNAVAPGFIETSMTQKLSDTAKEAIIKNIPMEKLGKPEDIADAVEFLISEKASYITGQVLSVNGGLYM